MKNGLMKMMMVTFVLAIVSSSNLMAQRGQGLEAGNKLSPEERATKMTEKMTEKLGLNDYQSDQMASLNLSLAQDVKAIKDGDLPKEEKRAAMKSLRDSFNSQATGILDADQMAQLEKWQEKRKKKKGPKGGKGQCQEHK